MTESNLASRSMKMLHQDCSKTRSELQASLHVFGNQVRWTLVDTRLNQNTLRLKDLSVEFVLEPLKNKVKFMVSVRLEYSKLASSP